MKRKELEHLEEVAENSFYIGKAYKELYDLEIMNKLNSREYNNVLNILKTLKIVEDELYSYYNADKINNVVKYISDVYNYESGDHISEEIMKDYIDYNDKKPLSDDDLLFRDALIARMFHRFFLIMVEEIQVSKKSIDESNIINKEIVSNLSYLIKKHDLTKRSFLTFSKYDTIMRKSDVESILLEDNFVFDHLKCGSKFKETIGKDGKEYLTTAISVEARKILDHLNTYTDEMLENKNNQYASLLDQLFFNSYLILLNEEEKEMIEDYYNEHINSLDYRNTIKNGGGKKVKRLIKNSFAEYEQNRNSLLGEE